jgi:putative flippase GtrA
LAVTDRQLEEMTLPARRLLHSRRQTGLQFIKFCLVGTISTAINVKLFSVLMAQGLGVNLSHICAFSLAVTNGFILNRAWTFRQSRTHRMERQYLMFVVVNLVGLALSWSVMRLVGAWLIHWDVSHAWLLQSAPARFLAGLLNARSEAGVEAARLAYSIGELAATPLCAVWNFSANKLWTFGGGRKDKSAE